MPDLTKAIWEVEMNEVDPQVGGQQKIHLVYVDLHAATRDRQGPRPLLRNADALV